MTLEHFPPGSEKFISHPSLAKPGIHPFPDKLYVVTMLENPLRWRSRYANYWAFAKHVEDAGAVLYTCEIAFGGRPFEITEPGQPNQLQLRTSDELWHKENALNLAIQRLPADAAYVAWIDADITFARPDWAQETLHLLQHYDVIQMFSQAQDMNADNEPTAIHSGFVYEYLKALANPLAPKNIPASYGSGHSGGSYWHPGFAWAARRSSLAALGMLIDWAILGSADWHMAWGLIGLMAQHLHDGLSANYRNWCLEWQSRAEQHIKRNVGCLPGLALHSYHGSKDKRAYADRWAFLAKAKFDPAIDLKRDWQGLWQLSGNNPALRDGIRQYARQRHEDS